MVNHKGVAVLSIVCLFLAGPAHPAEVCVSAPQFPDIRFGLNFDDLSATPTDVSTAMARAEDSHLGVIRLWVWWKWMESAPGVIDFTALDTRVNAATAQGLRVLLTFASIPAWANGSAPSCDFWGGQCSAPPVSSSHFANFAYAVSNRYKDVVGYYELWNEADHSVFWTASMSQLNNLIVQPGAASIRSADPTATILSPSFYTSKTSLKVLLGLSCNAHDAVAVHSYDGSASAMKTRVNGKWTSAMTEAGCVQPLWVTEFGIDSQVVGEAAQASEYSAAAAHLLNGTLAAERLIFYRLEDHLDGSAGWGITRRAPTYTIKPSYTSLQSTVPRARCTSYP